MNPSPRLKDRQGGEYIEPSAPPASIIVPEETEPVESAAAVVVPMALTVEPSAPASRPQTVPISLAPLGVAPNSGPGLAGAATAVEPSIDVRVVAPGAPPVPAAQLCDSNEPLGAEFFPGAPPCPANARRHPTGSFDTRGEQGTELDADHAGRATRLEVDERRRTGGAQKRSAKTA